MAERARYDLVVIGGGPGGYVSAIRAAQFGLKTAIIEGHKMGGECLNYGCIPSKAVITAGHVIDKIKLADKMGIMVKGVEIDLAKLIDWKAGIVKQLTGGVTQLLKANGVTAYKGLASFTGMTADKKTKTIKVDASVDSYNGQKLAATEELLIDAERVIIATGSSAVQIPTMPFNGKTILGSLEALEVKVIPKKIVVIGGGSIGLEIGTFYAKLGTEVTVVEATGGLLPGTDRDCVDVVQKKLIKRGVKLFLNTKALNIQDTATGAMVTIEGPAGGGTIQKQNVDCDWVLVTVGRKPRTTGLALDKVGLKTTDKGFIEVKGDLQTIVPGIYAIGDVIGGPMLAHKASMEGLVAVESMLRRTQMDVRALPWAVFVDPEIAVVGHSEESARAAGWDPVVGKCPFVANGRALTTGEAEGFVKLIADRKTDRLLGAHMVGPDVSNLIAEVALGIELGATSEDIARTIHAHPTLPETLVEAAESVHGMAVHFFERKPRRTEIHGHA